MINLLPAVLIGGPPHAGKSTLTYSLTQALRKRGIAHFVIRACPDGEGDWSQEIDQSMVRRVRIKGEWTPEFVQYVCKTLERRHFPLLVDIGGRPQEWQTGILNHCTHSLLLLHQDNETTADFWRKLVIAHGLLPLADLYSLLEGPGTIDEETPVIKGTISGLQPNTIAQGPLFELLVDRIGALFTSFSAEELRKGHLDAAPAQVVDLDAYLQAQHIETQRWEPDMLMPFLATLPQNTALAIYGRAPNWLYAALALHTGKYPFYQFDSRLGWVIPPPLKSGTLISDEVERTLEAREHFTLLSAHPRNDHLEYESASALQIPPVPINRGVVLSGKLPFWLVTAIVRLYHSMGSPWIACDYPPMKGAIVVMSQDPTYVLGQCIPLEVC
jgi:CRISPR-associated protein Csx3